MDIDNNWWDQTMTKENNPVSWGKHQFGDLNFQSRQQVRQFYLDTFNGSLFTVADLGCGYGIEVEGYIQNKINVDYTGYDFSQFMIETASKRLPNQKFVRCNMLNVPVADNTYDVVLLRHVLEHQEDHMKVLNEAIRISKKYILIVTFKERSRNKHIIRLKPKAYFDNILSSSQLQKELASLNITVKQRIEFKKADRDNVFYSCEKNGG